MEQLETVKIIIVLLFMVNGNPSDKVESKKNAIIGQWNTVKYVKFKNGSKESKTNNINMTFNFKKNGQVIVQRYYVKQTDKWNIISKNLIEITDPKTKQAFQVQYYFVRSEKEANNITKKINPTYKGKLYLLKKIKPKKKGAN